MDQKRELERVIDESDARMGVLIFDAQKSRSIFGCNEDERFHLASVIKMLILLECLVQAQEGRLDLNEKVYTAAVDRCPGSFWGMLDAGKYFTIAELLRLMILLSDSLIADYLLQRISIGALNKRLKGWGLANTKIDLSILDLNLQSYGLSGPAYEHIKSWQELQRILADEPGELEKPENIARSQGFRFEEHNYSTPADICTLLDKFLAGSMMNDELTQLGKDILMSQYSKTRIPYLLPPWLEDCVGHQIGTVTGESGYLVINDCGFICFEDKAVILVFLADSIRGNFYRVNNSIAKASLLISERLFFV